MTDNGNHVTTDNKVMTEEEYWAQRAEQEQLEKAEHARTAEEAWKQHDAEERLAEAECASRTKNEIDAFYADDTSTERPETLPEKQAATRRKKAAHQKKRCQKKAQVADLSRTSRLNDDVKNGMASVTKEKDSNGNIVKKVRSRPGSKTSRADTLKKKAYPGNKKPTEDKS